MTSHSNPTKAELTLIKNFILWAKKNNVQLYEVSIGSVKLVLTDYELLDLEKSKVVQENKDTAFQEIPTPEPKTMYDELASRRGIKPKIQP